MEFLSDLAKGAAVTLLGGVALGVAVFVAIKTVFLLTAVVGL